MAAMTLWSVLDMLKLNAAAFQNAVYSLARIRAEVMAQPKPRRDHISDVEKLSLHIYLTMLHESLTILECAVSNRAVIDLKALLDLDSLRYSGLVKKLAFIEEAMPTELDSRLVLVVAPDTATYYAPKEPLFGPDVAAAFPSIQYDIEEAGKCLALDRSTASAFHSIRCLEAGLRAICRYLSIPDPMKGSDRSWTIIQRKIEAAMESKWPKSHRISGEGKLIEEMNSQIVAMQNPYRNDTMHLDATYTKEASQQIFTLVKGIMQSVAKQMDENGKQRVRMRTAGKSP